MSTQTVVMGAACPACWCHRSWSLASSLAWCSSCPALPLSWAACAKTAVCVTPTCGPATAPDGMSYGGSIGELRSTCIQEFPPAFDFDSYVETLSQVNVMYPDSPPHYDECVGPGATQIYVPTDDPPPYSLMDPCQRVRQQVNYTSLEMGETSAGAGASWVSASSAATSSHYPIRLQELRHQQIASISLSALPLEEAPPYEAVVRGQNQPLPLMPMEQLKHPSEDSHSPQRAPAHRIL
ncbi:hypothetical protein UPYG_G00081730 [Umbra pygmaea]|uniref:Uncharacterized protein n=1 Tax=Umbra pygmaea TaxID=75934 RepID=A0ABD0XDZ0_UMBPY